MEKDSYPSDLSDNEWSVIEPLIPGPSKLGRPPRYDKRRVLDGIFYVVRSGIAWRMMPKDLPPWRICYHYFSKWKDEGIWLKLHEELRGFVRYRSGKKKAPTAAIIDAQSVRAAGHPGLRGYDAGKKVKGIKRHLLVDTLGLVLVCVVHSASVQDRDGARLVLAKLESAFGWIRKVWADGGYAGKLVQWVSEISRHRKVELEIIRRCDKAEGFKLLPRRWVVERTFAWLSQQGRLVVDRETKTCSSEAMIHLAMIRLMVRRLAI
ncbi:IS5 family transposase [Pelagicoccus enzymogenes]|uniref:IS5 family transposase n=1 Tax=Pelagicoccus enzymogenes TaxID=2773457 RepID=UPI00280E6F46|nr:IS5 family transposase [Pelagicoccus enzymogenes]MDQ8200897.1 IS5 family transposase [Pelagicoccus enzymogenes]